MSPEPRSNRVPLLLSIAVIAILLRLIPWTAVFPAGSPVRMVSPDCEYHLIRVQDALAGRPMRIFDVDLNFPDGGVSIWPTLFDQGAAWLVRLARVISPDLTPVAGAAFWAPLLGTIYPFVILLLAGSLLPRRWTFAAAIWAAGIPAFLLYSQLGHLDQHVAEALLSALAIAFLARGVAGPGDGTRPRQLVLAGTAAGLLVLTWQGGIYLAPVAVCGLFFARALKRRRPLPTELAAYFAPCTALAAGGTALMLRGEPPLPFTFVSVSWFQPVFLAFVWFGATALSLRRRPDRMQLAATAAGILAGLTSLLLAGREMFVRIADMASHFLQRSAEGRMDSGGYLHYPASWLRVIGEDHPLWPPAELMSKGSEMLTWVGLVALPLAILVWTRRALRNRRGAEAVLLVAAAVHVVLAISQRRYAFYLATFTSLAVPTIVRHVSLAVGHRGFVRRAPALAALLLLPAIPFWRALPTTIEQPGGDAARFMAKIRQVVAAPPRDAAGRAAWGVAAPWSYGHTILRWTGLPVAADNFGYGFEDQARLWLAPSDEEAMSILRRHRVKYVLTTRLEPILPIYAANLGRPAPGPDAFGYRLHRGLLPAALFRPVLESNRGDRFADGRIVSRYRLFEFLDR